MTRGLLALGLAGLWPLMTGFVLLGPHKATLPVTPENPTLTFQWDGRAPELNKKDEVMDGAYKDLDDQEFMAQLLAYALNKWNEVPGAYVNLQVVEGTDVKLDDTDKVFSIETAPSSNVTTAAFATPRMENETPDAISDCDISIADHAVEAKDLAFTITHELGHCLGLGHAHTNYGAIMGYSRDTRNVALGADDMAGIIYLYPDPAYVDEEPRELVCGVVGGHGAGGFAVLGLLALPLALALRPRSSRSV